MKRSKLDAARGEEADMGPAPVPQLASTSPQICQHEPPTSQWLTVKY